MVNQYSVSSDDPLNSFKDFCNLILSAIRNSLSNRQNQNKIHNVNCINLQNQNDNDVGRSRSKLFRHLSELWWNERCARAVRNNKEALVTFPNNVINENYLNFKKLRVHAENKLVIKKKRYCDN